MTACLLFLWILRTLILIVFGKVVWQSQLTCDCMVQYDRLSFPWNDVYSMILRLNAVVKNYLKFHPLAKHKPKRHHLTHQNLHQYNLDSAPLACHQLRQWYSSWWTPPYKYQTRVSAVPAASVHVSQFVQEGPQLRTVSDANWIFVGALALPICSSAKQPWSLSSSYCQTNPTFRSPIAARCWEPRRPKGYGHLIRL